MECRGKPSLDFVPRQVSSFFSCLTCLTEHSIDGSCWLACRGEGDSQLQYEISAPCRIVVATAELLMLGGTFLRRKAQAWTDD
jgi:hypothetical protein